MQEIIAETVLDAKPHEGAKLYWNLDCTRVTQAAREKLKQYRYCRDRSTKAALDQAEREKVKVLWRARTLDWREGVYKVILKLEGVWRLAKWGRQRSTQPKELS